MASIGVQGLHIAPVVEDVDGIETFSTPEKLAKLIKIGLAIEVAEGVLFGDNAIAEIIKEFTKGKITINTTDLTNEQVAKLLGQTIDKDGVIYAGENDEPPYFAVGFIANKTKGKNKYLWLYKVKFQIPSEEYETKGDGINFITPTIEGEFIKLNKNGKWKADVIVAPASDIAKSWFTVVKEFVEQTPAVLKK